MSFSLYANMAFDIGLHIPSTKYADTGVKWIFENFKVIDERVFLELPRADLYTKDMDENKVTFIPTFFGVRVDIPANGAITPFAGGAIGWGFAFRTRYSDDVNYNKDKTFSYGGFVYELNAGAKYPLGSFSELYGKGYYMLATLKDGGGKNARILDMSGPGISIGMKFIY
jgi:hypothetical protein